MASSISAIWANDGGDKVTQDELRLSNGVNVANSVWQSGTVTLFGAMNEVISFSLILEAATAAASNVSVTLSNLSGPSGSVIRSVPRATNNLFNWTGTEAELFFVRYLQIRGLSKFGYAGYGLSGGTFEPQLPEKLRTPLVGGVYTGGWVDRPNHDKFYPEIAVPLELSPSFPIAAAANQSIWADIYIPKTVAAGAYTGTVTVSENGVVTHTIPVALAVKNFALPDLPTAKTMMFAGYAEVARRYTGSAFPPIPSAADTLAKLALANQRYVAHRHKISIVGDDPDFAVGTGGTQPSAAYAPFLDGTAFTSANGYAGPGTGIGNNVYSIGSYGSWQSAAWPATQSGFWTNTNAWETWFAANAPATERFVYLTDESSNFAQTQQYADWMKTNPGVGHNLKSFATLSPKDAVNSTPSLNIACAVLGAGGSMLTADWTGPVNTINATPSKEFFMYNGPRPGQGIFSTEGNGTDLREKPWGQYKKGVSRWFWWDSTYYNQQQTGAGDTDVFNQASTFNGPPQPVASLAWSATNGGQVAVVMTNPTSYSNGSGIFVNGATNTGTGDRSALNGGHVINTFTDNQHFTFLLPGTVSQWGTFGGAIGISDFNTYSGPNGASNGDGVLFYPGTDAIYAASNYNVSGPIASLRMKHWRRGIQDIDYVTLAAAINPSAVTSLVQQMVPLAMWELTVVDPNDPTYYNNVGPSWSSDPNVWEAARAQLAAIITGSVTAGVPVNTVAPTISGIAQVGQTLTASNGTWTNSPASFTYQWNRTGVPISGATASTYVPVSADVGNALTVSVVATNSSGSSFPALSPATSTVTAAGAVPANSSLPTISGTAQVGQTLTAAPGAWTNSPASYAYQWAGNGASISGAAASTYVPASGDVGQTLTVSVIATNSVGASVPAISSPTAAVVATAGAPPISMAAPVVTGTAQVGQTLTTSNGTWSNSPTTFTFQWNRYQINTIAGATASTYIPVVADIGIALQATVFAANSTGSSHDNSLPTSVVIVAAAGVPVNTALPTISGTAQVGQRLTATTGAWTNSPTSYAYQWAGNGTNITGATASTYVPVAGDVGHMLTVSVIATNSVGSSAPATSAATSVVIAAVTAPVNTGLPAVTGTAQVGQTLTAVNGTWTNSPTSYTYQWNRAGTPISGATTSTYVPVSADVGNNITVSVTAVNGAGSSSPATSAATTSVIDIIPTNTGLPAISGAAQVGKTLTASTGTWMHNPASYSYQWAGNGTNITGATASAYVPVAGDVGHTLTASVVATNSGGSSPAATSAATSAVIAIIPTNSVLPAISGTAQVGQTLTASTGTWTNSPTSYAYQWAGNGTNITGATASTYVPVAADVGHTLKVSVVATNSGGSSTAATSAATGAVAPAGAAPVNTVPPVIIGTAHTGQTLSATTGAWINNPTSFAYQWTGNGTNIAGATSATYVPVAGDVGHVLMVSVVATNAAGPSLSAFGGKVVSA